jgi:hypothetical protein
MRKGGWPHFYFRTSIPLTTAITVPLGTLAVDKHGDVAKLWRYASIRAARGNSAQKWPVLLSECSVVLLLQRNAGVTSSSGNCLLDKSLNLHVQGIAKQKLFNIFWQTSCTLRIVFVIKKPFSLRLRIWIRQARRVNLLIGKVTYDTRGKCRLKVPSWRSLPSRGGIKCWPSPYAAKFGLALHTLTRNKWNTCQ